MCVAVPNGLIQINRGARKNSGSVKFAHGAAASHADTLR